MFFDLFFNQTIWVIRIEIYGYFPIINTKGEKKFSAFFMVSARSKETPSFSKKNSHKIKKTFADY